MIPIGYETVTLIRRVETSENNKTRVSYARSTMIGCSWRSTAQRIRIDNVIQLVPQVSCRVPASQPRPAAGDCLFLGVDVPEITDARSLQAALDAAGANAMRVEAVSDRARPGMPMPHYLCTGA